MENSRQTCADYILGPTEIRENEGLSPMKMTSKFIDTNFK